MENLFSYIKVRGIASGNKLIKNDTISSHVKIWYHIDDFGDIKFVSKLYLNPLMYHRNIFGSSSKVFGNLRKSSDIFGNFRKFSENVRERLSGLRNNFEKSSENHEKRRHQYVYIIKRTLHVSSKKWILCSRGKNNISLVRCAHSWDILSLPLKHKIHIFSPPCNILYITSNTRNFQDKSLFY